jgi:RNA polymerase sigma factor (sigma-70 family)
MNDQDWLAERFEANRSHLRGVAYGMLGSVTEADDAVQEAWIRLSRTDVSEVDNLRAWLTTVVARVCLNMLRSRRTRRESSLETHLPDPIPSPEEGLDPEQGALLGDSIGLALLVVLDAGCRSGTRSFGSSMGSTSTVRWKRPRIDASSSSTRLAEVDSLYIVSWTADRSAAAGRGVAAG